MAGLLHRIYSLRYAPAFLIFFGGCMAHKFLSPYLPPLSFNLLYSKLRVASTTYKSDTARHSTPLAESITAEDVLRCSNEVYNQRGTRVVLLDDGKTVVKHGPRVGQNEVAALETVARFTDIPVPRVCRMFQHEGQHFLVMSRLPGTSLDAAWPSLSAAERKSIVRDLAAYVRQLRSIPVPPSFIGGADLGACRDDVFSYYKDERGPFQSIDELNDCITRIISRQAEDLGFKNLLCHHIRRSLFRPQPIVFTHGDLQKRNILVESGRVVGLVDWEQSGFSTESWEMCKAVASSRRSDDWLLWLEQIATIDYVDMSAFYNISHIGTGF